MQKSQHWECSQLSNFEIKQHKKNPYKPWWCVSCIEKYCKACSKTFSVNYDSICCDFCSFWHHFECSGLSKTEFDNLSNKPDTPWKCIPCKRKLCVSCNLSTHNKPKAICCVCGDLYHNVCVSLPKSTSKDDWLCKSCRPNIFPFHNVDYKNLMKLSNYHNKFSLENMSATAPDMSRTCSVCLKGLSKSNQGIPCHGCSSKVHVKCSKVSDPKNSFHAYKGNWQCETCMKNKFPFHDLRRQGGGAQGSIPDIFWFGHILQQI